MGQHRRTTVKSHTLPSSPTHSSSSSDFEFTIALSPRKSSDAALCPADELFYKGQLLPLHPSQRISMVRTLLLSSSSSSSSDTTTTASRESTDSTTSSSTVDLLNCDSSRPSSVMDDEFKLLNTTNNYEYDSTLLQRKPPSKYFSLARFSSVFRKEHKNAAAATSTSSAAVKRVSSSAKEVIRKYLKKVKPLYEKLSQPKQQQKFAPPSDHCTRVSRSTNATFCTRKGKGGNDKETANSRSNESGDQKFNRKDIVSHSFSGNLRYPRGKSCTLSCPSSMGSSPSHGRSGFGFMQMSRVGSSTSYSDSTSSSMEELQSAIQGAIAHCKNSMTQNNKSMVSIEI